jgi:GNAT superfamily N-acetyltransferase
LSDVPYIDALRRREADAIGFLPLVVYEWVAGGSGAPWKKESRLWLAEANGDRVGFLYLTPGSPGGVAHIGQVCVQADARRLDYATALVERAEHHARLTQRGAVAARVATDLEATAFWDALGYRLTGYEEGGRRRGRVLERRHKPLPLPLERLLAA